MKKIFLLPMFLCILISCNSSNIITELDGLYNNSITLSDNNIMFSRGENSVVVTSEYSFGWMDEIKLGDTSYYCENEIIESDEFVIEEDLFTIERNEETLYVKMDKNETGIERTMFIGLQSGNCFGSLKIIQATN